MKIRRQSSVLGCFFTILFLVGNFECKKQTCGNAADGALNFMTFVGVSAQIIINVVNNVNNNNNNNNSKF